MLRTIKKPTVYAAGPEVFNMIVSDQEYLEAWGRDEDMDVLHPRRYSDLSDPEEIFKNCIKDAETSDVILADVSDFRGKDADSGTSAEIGLARRSGAIILGYKEKKEHPVLRFGERKEIEGKPVDENGYFIEETSDRNLMIEKSLDAMFYGSKEEILGQVTDYINKNVRGWYRHEDPLLGRKLLPPGTEKVFETLTPNIEVELTRFASIIETEEMRRHREIKQLGALFWIYPDATHTRYAHMVMTFKIVRDMLSHLTNLTTDEKLHIMAYALVHDIGHTPYSHELEEIVNLDQSELAKKIIQKPEFKQALEKCGVNLETLLTFFDKENPNPLKQIVSDKVLGADKLAYLLRDGIATGKGGYDFIDLITQHTIYEDGKFGIDEKGAESALKQIQLYHTTYAATYFNEKSKGNQRVFTLLGQIAIEDGTLPEDWSERNDLWYDFYNILAEEKGNEQLKKLGADGIVKQSYNCIGSFRLEDAKILERSGITLESITEKEYNKFMSIPVKERKIVEEKLCEIAGVEPLDLIISHAGDINRLRIDDTWVFKNGIEKPVRLLADMYPNIKEAYEKELKRQAVAIRLYSREDTADKIRLKLPEVMKALKEIINNHDL